MNRATKRVDLPRLGETRRYALFMQQLATDRDEIEDLRDWATADDDAHTVALCDRALAGDIKAWMLCAMILQASGSN